MAPFDQTRCCSPFVALDEFRLECPQSLLTKRYFAWEADIYYPTSSVLTSHLSKSGMVRLFLVNATVRTRWAEDQTIGSRLAEVCGGGANFRRAVETGGIKKLLQTARRNCQGNGKLKATLNHSKLPAAAAVSWLKLVSTFIWF